MTKIKPAASERHWSMFQLQVAGKMIGGAQSPCTEAVEEAGDRGQRHMLAAFALYGQPFGFTREDVEALRELVDDAESYLTDMGPVGEGWKSPELTATIARAERIADRIEALLPPKMIP